MIKNFCYDIKIERVSTINNNIKRLVYAEQKIQKNNVINTIKHFLKNNISITTLDECVLHDFKNKISIPFSKFKTKENVLCISYCGYDIEI